MVAMSRRWVIFYITSSNFFLSQFYRASNAVIANDLLVDLSLDTKGLGTISAAFFYAFALTQIPISILLDRIGPRRMMTGLSLVGIVGAFIFASANSMGMGLLGRILLGIGMACNLMGTLKLMTVWFKPTTFATLTGAIFSIGTAGNMAATTPMVFLVNAVGWRDAFVIIGVINLFLVLGLYLTVRDNPPEKLFTPPEKAPQNIQSAFSGLLFLFKKKEYWIISMSSFIGYGIYGSFQTLWAGPYLTEVMGLSVMNAGHLIFLMNVGAILGAPVWGALSDRFFKTRKWVVTGGLLIVILIMLLFAGLPVGTGFALLMLIFVSFGFFRATGGLMYVHIKEIVPLSMAGTAMTGINFFTMIGPAFFLQGLGILMQTLYPGSSRGPEAFVASFLVCAFCLLMVAVAYAFTRDTMKKDV